MTGEVRHALRRLKATPVVTLSAVACLAIGVWMTCIMSAIGLAQFRPNLHISEPDRVVQPSEPGLYSVDESDGPFWGPVVSSRVYEAMTRDPDFSAVGYIRYEGPTYLENQNEEEMWLRATSYSAGMARVLRLHPMLGRAFIPSDDTVGGVAILSNGLWRSRYGADSGIVGKRIRLKGENRSRTIIGVMAEDFIFPSRRSEDLYLSADWLHDGTLGPSPERFVFARLAPGASLDEARDRLRLEAARTSRADREEAAAWLRAAYGKRTPPQIARGGIDTRLERYRHLPLTRESLRLVLLILGCGFAVVAVATANVVNLLLVRGASRRQEIAVRMALGADRLRVLRELVVETMLLALPAMAIGFGIAWKQWSLINPSFYLRHDLGDIDVRVAVAAIAAGLTLSLVAGTWPGLRATSIGLEQVLRDARRSGVTASPLDGVLSRLVTASTAATVMLLICAALLGLTARDAANDLTSLQSAVLASDLRIDGADGTARLTNVKATLANLRRQPGVASAALGQVPLRANRQDIFASRTGEPGRRLGSMEVYSVTDGFFETMSIQVLRGRTFSVREARDSSGLVVISRELAGTLFGAREAVGERFRYRRGTDSTVVDAQVIGVVENMTTYGLRLPQMYLPYGAHREAAATALVRYRRRVHPQPKDMASALSSTNGIAAGVVSSIAERLKRTDPLRHYLGLAFGMFAIVALVIAVVGTYGVVAYSVVRRTHEIGVRLALGADSTRVSRMVIEQGLKITLIGIAAGTVLAAAAVRVVGAYIQDLEIGYGGAIAGVIALVSILSFVASAIPAWRASRLNPVDALRAE